MIYLVITFLLTILIGVPVAFCLGIAALAFLVITGRESLLIIPTLMFGGIDSFPLLAIPFFILAGDLAERSGILPNLVKLANSLVGHLRAGLASCQHRNRDVFVRCYRYSCRRCSSHRVHLHTGC